MLGNLRLLALVACVLTLTGAPVRAVDQAAIDSAKLNLTYSHITAPASGRIGIRLVDPGNFVSAAASTPLLVITQMEPISVIFTIPEDSVSAVMAAGYDRS